MVKDAGDYLGMRGLDQEGSDAAHEDSGITHDQPGNRVRAKEPWIPLVESGRIQRVRRMGEELVGCVDYSLAQR